MVEQKPEEAFNSLRDNIPLYIIILLITIGCESSFKNFDDGLINMQIELQDFSEKSIVRKEEILEN
ncbi:MAG: hypothetical protein P8J53_02400 [Alphaproteobacteria bacterium]|jgi:hypothetical protein|nr:hypothetical protein [Alphaproteobacteria bacterium]